MRTRNTKAKVKEIIRDLIFQVSVVVLFIAIGAMAEGRWIIPSIAIVVSATTSWICLARQDTGNEEGKQLGR